MPRARRHQPRAEAVHVRRFAGSSVPMIDQHDANLAIGREDAARARLNACLGV
jgi:hypothetical protein